MITTQPHSGTRANVVGVDLSLTSTGIAVIDGPNVATFRIQSKGTKVDTVADRAQRIIDITGRIMECIPSNVAMVVLEAPSYGQQRQAGEHLRAGLWWYLATRLHLEGHRVVEVPPANLKRYATGKGNSPKDQVLAAVIRRYPNVDVTGNDIADALVLAAMGMRHLGTPIENSMPVANLAAMDKISWSGVLR
jgi:Holliday junction resolvasome RuvABC endonuclease subunit